jgi:hypothetical protein
MSSPLIDMSNFHDFLEEHAMFPFSELDDARSIGSTYIFPIEVRLLDANWKPKHAVR